MFSESEHSPPSETISLSIRQSISLDTVPINWISFECGPMVFTQQHPDGHPETPLIPVFWGVLNIFYRIPCCHTSQHSHPFHLIDEGDYLERTPATQVNG